MAGHVRNGLLILLSCLTPTSLAVTTGASVSPTLDCSLAIYILIGITVLYSLLSLVCLFLVILCCCCCSKRRNKIKPEDYENELDDVFLPSKSPLESIAETTATDLIYENENVSFTKNGSERTSSSSSSSSSSFSNNGSDIVLHNPGSSKSKSEETKRKSPQEGHKKTVLRARQLTGQLSNESPLLHHHPRGSPIPPSDVPVPFSEVKPSKPVDKVHKQVEDQSHQPHGPVRRLPPIRKSLTPRQKRKAVSLAVISNEEGAHQRAESLKPGSRSSQPMQKTVSDSSAFKLEKRDLNPPSKNSPFGGRKVSHNGVAEDLCTKSPVIIKKLVNIGEHSGEIKVLTESALKVEMIKISHKWKIVGQQFKVPTSTLRNINYLSNRENNKCMMRVCEEWLIINKNRTWNDVVGMLRSDEIGEKLLASDIHKRYCAGVVDKDSSSPVDNEDDAEGSLSWIN